MAKNVQKPLKFGVRKGGELIGGGALNGEFTVYIFKLFLKHPEAFKRKNVFYNTGCKRKTTQSTY